jgi:hypothetical protein
MKTRWFATGVVLRLVALLSGLGLTQAGAYYLTHNNSSVTVDPGSSQGMYNWQVDGANYLNQQWFWYRVGSTGPESPLNSLGGLNVNVVDSRSIRAFFTGAQFNAEISYYLTGGAAGSGWSDVAESITLYNTNANASVLDMHFFQYSDFDLSSGSDTVTLSKNILGKFNEARQTGTSFALAETVTTPGANRGEAGNLPSTLNKLSDGFTDNLNNSMNATGNVTWAFQWDLRIAAGGSVIITKDKLLQVPPIPEPSSLALLGLGVLALMRRRSK